MFQTEGRIPLGDGMELFHRSMGEGPEPTLIPNSRVLAQEFRTLAKERRIIIYDQRGRGAHQQSPMIRSIERIRPQ